MLTKYFCRFSACISLSWQRSQVQLSERLGNKRLLSINRDGLCVYFHQWVRKFVLWSSRRLISEKMDLAHYMHPVDGIHFCRVFDPDLHSDSLCSNGFRSPHGCQYSTLCQSAQWLHNAIWARYRLIDICCRSILGCRNELHLNHYRWCNWVEEYYQDHLLHLLGNRYSDVLHSWAWAQRHE